MLELHGCDCGAHACADGGDRVSRMMMIPSHPHLLEGGGGNFVVTVPCLAVASLDYPLLSSIVRKKKIKVNYDTELRHEGVGIVDFIRNE